MVEPKIGDWCVVRTNGILAKIVRYGTASTVNHAAIYVGEVEDVDKNGNKILVKKVLEARPGGLGYNTFEIYKDALWSTDNLPDNFVPTDDQRTRMVDFAVLKVGTKYGMLDIVAIALGQRKLGSIVKTKEALANQPWWIKRIQRKDRLICSQFVDLVAEQVGIHYFEDGRVEGLVSPEDLRQILINGIIEHNS